MLQRILVFKKSPVQNNIENIFEVLKSGNETDMLDAVSNLSEIPVYRIKINKKIFLSYLEKGSLVQKIVAQIFLLKLKKEGRE